MIEKTCRCGKTKKNFKVDIGPFFVDECCIAAGFDELGKKKLEVEDLGLDKSKVDQVLNSEETQNLEIVDEGEQPEPEIEESKEEQSEEEQEVDMDKEVEEAIKVQSEETKPEKKKRQYNRNGKLNVKKES